MPDPVAGEPGGTGTQHPDPEEEPGPPHTGHRGDEEGTGEPGEVPSPPSDPGGRQPRPPSRAHFDLRVRDAITGNHLPRFDVTVVPQGNPPGSFWRLEAAGADGRCLPGAGETGASSSPGLMLETGKVYDLYIRAEAYMPARLPGRAPAEAPTPVEVLLVPAACVTGTLRWAHDGSPAAGARLLVEAGHGGRPGGDGWPPPAVTGEDGHFDVQVPAERPATLLVRHEEGMPLSLEVDLPAAATRDLGDCELVPAGRLSVRVLPGGDTGVEGVKVQLTGEQHGPSMPDGTPTTASTDAEGLAVLGRIPAGTGTLMVSWPDGRTVRDIPFHVRWKQSLVIEVESPSTLCELVGRLRLDPPASGELLLVLWSLENQGAPREAARRRLPGEGSFTIQGLEPGRYRLEASLREDGWKLVGSRELTLLPGRLHVEFVVRKRR